MSEALVWAAAAVGVVLLCGYGIWALQQDNSGTPQQSRGILCLILGLLLLVAEIVTAVARSVPAPPPEAPVQGPVPGLVTRPPSERGGAAPAPR